VYRRALVRLSLVLVQNKAEITKMSTTSCIFDEVESLHIGFAQLKTRTV